MDNFESQLKRGVDAQSPPQLDRSLWLGVKDQLVTHRQRRLRRRVIRWAAAATVLILLGVSFFLFGPKSDKDQLVLEQYGLHQYDFRQKVQQRLYELDGAKIPTHQVAHFNALKNQLHFLDQQYQNYLLYIEQNGYQEFIGKQIQNYYEVKIELLEKIQKELEKLKRRKNENNNNAQLSFDLLTDNKFMYYSEKRLKKMLDKVQEQESEGFSTEEAA